MAVGARPDEIKITPIDDGGFGIDVRWTGGECSRRATAAREQLADAGVASQLEQDGDGGGCELHLGPVPGAEVVDLLDDHGLTPR